MTLVQTGCEHFLVALGTVVHAERARLLLHKRPVQPRNIFVLLPPDVLRVRPNPRQLELCLHPLAPRGILQTNAVGVLAVLQNCRPLRGAV